MLEGLNLEGEKYGYTFVGWKRHESGTHGWNYVSVDYLETVYYAHFIPIVVKTEVFSSPNNYTAGSYIDIAYGSDYKLDFKEYDGYNFRGYFSEENGEGTQFTDKDGKSLAPYDLGDDAIFYPYYIKTEDASQ